jgi:hypothetical protein
LEIRYEDGSQHGNFFREISWKEMEKRKEALCATFVHFAALRWTA